MVVDVVVVDGMVGVVVVVGRAAVGLVVFSVFTVIVFGVVVVDGIVEVPTVITEYKAYYYHLFENS